MNVHLVHAHPEPRSFVAAMRDVMQEAFQARGDVVTISDLYAMSFNPVLSGADFLERENPDYLIYALEQRHAYQTQSLSPDIQAEVDRVMAADLIAFSFPLFWFSTPSILKGWIERVFLSGPFYGGRRIYGKGGLAGKRAFAAVSLGGRAQMFGSGAIHGELETGMMRHFFQGTLGYVGLSVHAPFFAYHVPYTEASARQSILDHLRTTVHELDQKSYMAMPDLSLYDQKLDRIK